MRFPPPAQLCVLPHVGRIPVLLTLSCGHHMVRRVRARPGSLLPLPHTAICFCGEARVLHRRVLLREAR